MTRAPSLAGTAIAASRDGIARGRPLRDE